MTDPLERVLRANEQLTPFPGYWPEMAVWFEDEDEAETQFIECLEQTNGKGPCEIKGT